MAWSKTTRISVMLGIDTCFFFLELVTGFWVGSLALTADAFHMLNDIISLLVGLWAVVVARKATTDKYSYGWLRAEILGAFFNAVFLIALCVSIVLEALTRLLDPPEISNPKLILMVGCLGLASNLAGFAVLGGHGHSHGPGEHSHDGHEHGGHEHVHNHESLAEEGRAGIAAQQTEPEPDIFPETAVARFAAAHSGQVNRADGTRSEPPERCNSRGSATPRGRDRRRAGSVRHGRLTSIEDVSIHPASFRQEIIDASRPHYDEESSTDDGADENPIADEDPDEDTPLLKPAVNGHKHGRSHSRRSRRNSGVIHEGHNHNKPKKPGKKSSHGHNHDDMGMNAMVLHVIGDALGNVGVITTALVIWLTDWPGKLYADPAVSLFITLIILRSAIPLTIAASKILLQATPESIDLNSVREDIQDLPGVISCHHVHIWQLSDTQIVASMHIQVAFPISEEGGEKYMKLAKDARKCLHAYGIHSATIQPEFCLDEEHDHGEDAAMQLDGSNQSAAKAKCGKTEDGLCLLECVDNCVTKGCCSGVGTASGSRTPTHEDWHDDDEDHGHDHDHSHENGNGHHHHGRGE